MFPHFSELVNSNPELGVEKDLLNRQDADGQHGNAIRCRVGLERASLYSGKPGVC